jgi:membrane-associated PAP2 superfamily phosphatase
MNRTGLAIALGVAAVVGLIFGVFPELDLRLAALVSAVDYSGINFGLRFAPWPSWLREVGVWIPAVLVAPAAIALIVKLVLPRTRLLLSGRAIVFLITTLTLAPGLLANGILKEHWARSRPVEVREFGGTERFVAWWDPRGDCEQNCSFVTGDGSGAFWTLAPAALAPPAWRPVAYGAALAFGTAVSVLRLVFGAHFFTDVVFAGVFTFLIIWLVHGFIYRWPKTRFSDDAVERRIEQIVMPAHRLGAAIAAGLAAFFRRHVWRRSSRQG